MGWLQADAADVRRWSEATPQKPQTELSMRVTGTGPYEGGKHGKIFLLRGGVLQALGGPHANLKSWSEIDSQRVQLGLVGKERSPVVATFLDCYVMRFAPVASDDLPAKYGDGVSKENAEWILRPAATTCRDACTGLTLRKLTAADREGSALARSVEDCCNFGWAGFGGLRFHPNGVLESPWGAGIWGAPPEAQGKRPALLAEFAGSKHLLRYSGSGSHFRMDSLRCADNDPASIAVISGQPTPL